MRTRDIETSIKFYSLFGFQVESKFRAGPAKAAWLTTSINNKEDNSSVEEAAQSRIELIEIPPHILQEKEGTRKRAIDLLENEMLLGLNHIALDVTHLCNSRPARKVSSAAEKEYELDEFISDLNTKSLDLFGKSLRVALNPQEQIIGKYVYELAFLYDADGSIVELLNKKSKLQNEQSISNGWAPLSSDDIKF